MKEVATQQIIQNA